MIDLAGCNYFISEGLYNMIKTASIFQGDYLNLKAFMFFFFS